MTKQLSVLAGVMFVCAALVSAVSRHGAVEPIQNAGTDAAAPVMVMVELFTSEGCSSCPPADDVLTRFITTQPVSGVIVVALGEHVDYWDRLGWRDPFSSASLTSRQTQYGATVFRTGNIYTPQMVIDGRLEGIGSDFGAIRKAVLEAARTPKANITVSARREGDDVRVNLSVDAQVPGKEPADVTVAITEDRLVTAVRRGENGGRTLRHSAVVRSMTTVGELMPGNLTFKKSVSSALARDWKSENLRLVAFVQERQSRRIVGVGTVAPDPPVERP